MDGFDKDWQQTSTGQYNATYTNLNPGTYSFRVKLKGQEASLKIEIDPPFWQTTWFQSLIAILVIGSVFLINFILIRRRKAEHSRQLLEAHSHILELKNEKLAAEVDAKNSKLMFSSVQMAYKNEILIEIRKMVNELKNDTISLKPQILRRIDSELKNDDYWKNFALYFDEVDKDFLKTLRHQHPNLTQNDLRMCALIRTNLTVKEIASLLNISVRGVEQSRYRLKKRLGLSHEEDLSTYISGFSDS